jgi:hypothetical protein
MANLPLGEEDEEGEKIEGSHQREWKNTPLSILCRLVPKGLQAGSLEDISVENSLWKRESAHLKQRYVMKVEFERSLAEKT